LSKTGHFCLVVVSVETDTLIEFHWLRNEDKQNPIFFPIAMNGIGFFWCIFFYLKAKSN
jgi:hypothetical protein